MASEVRGIVWIFEQIHFAIGISPVGNVLVGESPNGICAVYLGKSAKELMASLQKQFPTAKCVDGGSGIKNTLSKVIEIIHNPQKNTDFNLDLRGTTFQQQVWQALREIPVGSTVCYSDIAEKLHKPGSVRSIASAFGANNIAVIFPCHRVIRKNGANSG